MQELVVVKCLYGKTQDRIGDVFGYGEGRML